MALEVPSFKTVSIRAVMVQAEGPKLFRWKDSNPFRLCFADVSSISRYRFIGEIRTSNDRFIHWKITTYANMRYGIFWLLGKCTHRCGHLPSKRIVLSADLEIYPDHNLRFPRPDHKTTTALDQEIGGLNLRDSISYTSHQRRGLRTLSLFMALEEAVSPRGPEDGDNNTFWPEKFPSLRVAFSKTRILSFRYIASFTSLNASRKMNITDFARSLLADLEWSGLEVVNTTSSSVKFAIPGGRVYEPLAGPRIFSAGQKYWGCDRRAINARAEGRPLEAASSCPPEPLFGFPRGIIKSFLGVLRSFRVWTFLLGHIILILPYSPLHSIKSLYEQRRYNCHYYGRKDCKTPSDANMVLNDLKNCKIQSGKRATE